MVTTVDMVMVIAEYGSKQDSRRHTHLGPMTKPSSRGRAGVYAQQQQGTCYDSDEEGGPTPTVKREFEDNLPNAKAFQIMANNVATAAKVMYRRSQVMILNDAVAQPKHEYLGHFAHLGDNLLCHRWGLRCSIPFHCCSVKIHHRKVKLR